MRCQEPGKHNCKEVPINKVQHKTIYRDKKMRRKLPAGREAYVSSSSSSNRSATTRATSSTPTLVAPTDPSTGPCTAGFREMPGSWLRSTSARGRPPPMPKCGPPPPGGFRQPPPARISSSRPSQEVGARHQPLVRCPHSEQG
jgi:hypothetical protein